MGKRILILAGVVFIGTQLLGCATVKKNDNMELQGLKNQVQVLETQLQAKDEEINNLKMSQVKAPEEKECNFSKKMAVSKVKDRPKLKQIQIALKNAGYNPGAIDGKMGKQTRESLKAFQKANGLKVTGAADKNTWRLLRKYLYQRVK